MPIKTAYVSGALTGLSTHDSQRMKQAYEAIAKACGRAGVDAYVPHLHSDPDKHADISAQVVYEMDTKEVRARDLFIVEATFPSHGVGGEAVIASLAGKPILLFHEEGCRVSRYIRGVPGLRAELPYKSIKDLQWKLDEWLKENKG